MGRNISTKSLFGNVREDVTWLYKYPEGKPDITLLRVCMTPKWSWRLLGDGSFSSLQGPGRRGRCT